MTDIAKGGETLPKEETTLVGKKNIYTCTAPGCGAHIVTVDRDAGVTPFMIPCKIPGCPGMMQSSMYRVFDQNMRAFWEWYKPPVIQLLTPCERDHVEKGGLLLRRIPASWPAPSANDHFLAAVRALLADVESVARDSFATSAETFEADWLVEDERGYRAWSAVRDLMPEAAP